MSTAVKICYLFTFLTTTEVEKRTEEAVCSGNCPGVLGCKEKLICISGLIAGSDWVQVIVQEFVTSDTEFVSNNDDAFERIVVPPQSNVVCVLLIPVTCKLVCGVGEGGH